MSNLELIRLQLRDAEGELCCAEQKLDCAKKLVQSKKTKVESLRKLEGNQTSEPSNLTDTFKIRQHDPPRIIAIRNGKLLADCNAQKIKQDDYDVILDMTNASLKYRKDPINKSKLITSKLEGIGPERIRPLARLLEHPSIYISKENSGTTANTISQTMCLLRKALGQKDTKGPYIESVVLYEGLSHTAYRLILDRRYLLIKEIIENH